MLTILCPSNSIERRRAILCLLVLTESEIIFIRYASVKVGEVRFIPLILNFKMPPIWYESSKGYFSSKMKGVSEGSTERGFRVTSFLPETVLSGFLFDSLINHFTSETWSFSSSLQTPRVEQLAKLIDTKKRAKSNKVFMIKMREGQVMWVLMKIKREIICPSH